MSYHSWHVGMKVVYTGDSYLFFPRRGIRSWFGKFDKQPSRLNVGEVYEISGIDVGRDRVTGREEIGICLRGDPDGAYEGMHAARCFRPVQTRKTDISVLKAILLNPHIPVREDA
jgi:hypothetical protein